MSRPFHLSRISSSYSLGGLTSASSSTAQNVTLGGVRQALTTENAAAAGGGEDEFGAGNNSGAAAGIDTSHDEEQLIQQQSDSHSLDDTQSPQLHHVHAPYQNAAEIDPYALNTSAASSLFPSGLLGLNAHDETSRDSHAEHEHDGAEGDADHDHERAMHDSTGQDEQGVDQQQHENDDGGRTGQYEEEASMNREDGGGDIYDSAANQNNMDDDDPTGVDRRFDDAEMPQGWVGSSHEEDEAHADQQRDGEQQDEDTQFNDDNAVAHGKGRKRTREEDASDDERDRNDRSGDDNEGEYREQQQQQDQFGDTSEPDDSLHTEQATNVTQFLPPPPSSASAYASYAAPVTPISSHRNSALLASAAAQYPSTPLSSSHLPYINPSASSPHYSGFSPHHSQYATPHLGPTSPRIHSHYYNSSAIPFGSTSAGASSPRQDTIASVTHRIEFMQRSGRLAAILQTAARCNQEVLGSNGSSQPIPDYYNLTSGNTARSSSKQALISIDQHLLRRYIFNVLDSDMIIRGVVSNKNSQGLIINIAEILWPMEKAREVLTKQHQAAQQLITQLSTGKELSSERTSANKLPTPSSHHFPPLSSFLGGIPTSSASLASSSSSSSILPPSALPQSEFDSTYVIERALFSNFDMLAIHGECHLAEMHAPVAIKPDMANVLAVPSIPSLERFSLGDQVKALVISVDIHSEKVYLSMNQNRLRGQVAAMHKLGVIPKEGVSLAASHTASPALGPLTNASNPTLAAKLANLNADLQEKISAFGTTPLPSPTSATTPSTLTAFPLLPPSTSSWSYNSYLKSNGNTTPTHPSTANLLSSPLPPHLLKSRTPLNPKLLPSAPTLQLLANPLLLSKAKNFLQYLHEQPLFKNPEGVNKLTSCYHINQYGCLSKRIPAESLNLYTNLRHAQNQAWAKESVVKGISLAKKGSFDNAMTCYKHALDIEPNFTQAYVARGAAYVLQGLLKKAIGEFEKALKIDPEQEYAIKYLKAAREKLTGRPTPSTTSGGSAAVASQPANSKHIPSSATSSSSSRSNASSSAAASSAQDEHDSKKSKKRHRRDSSKSSSKRPSSSTSSSASPSPDASSSSLDPLIKQQQEVLELYAKEAKRRAKESKKERKKERKREREKEHKKQKSSKKSKKEEVRHQREPSDGTRSDRSRSSSSSHNDEFGSSSANAIDVSMSNYGQSATPPLHTPLDASNDLPPIESPNDASQQNDSTASAVQLDTIPSPASQDAIDDGWFRSSESTQELPPVLPPRTEADTPTGITPLPPALPEHDETTTSEFPNTASSPSNVVHTFASPSHIPVSLSSSSPSGMVLSPGANPVEQTHNFATPDEDTEMNEG